MALRLCDVASSVLGSVCSNKQLPLVRCLTTLASSSPFPKQPHHSKNNVLPSGHLQTAGVHHHLERGNPALFLGIVRSNRTKANRHYNNRDRRLRAAKTVKINLPDFERMRKLEKRISEGNWIAPDEMRSEILRRGIRPHDDWPKLSSDPYPFADSAERDARPNALRPIHLGGGMQIVTRKFDQAKSLIWERERDSSMSSLQQLQKLNPVFNQQHFLAHVVKDVFEGAHQALQQRDLDELRRYATNAAIKEMWPLVLNGSLKWRVEWTAPLEIVSVAHIPTQGMDFGQVAFLQTTKQALAYYDRFGRKVYGHDELMIPNCEVVVYEANFTDNAPKQKDDTPVWRILCKRRDPSGYSSAPMSSTMMNRARRWAGKEEKSDERYRKEAYWNSERTATVKRKQN